MLHYWDIWSSEVGDDGSRVPAYRFPMHFYPELPGVTFEAFPTEGVLGNAPTIELGPSTLGRMLDKLARGKR
eukprot:6320873-Alexandrium_andersonii.AAC.1